MSRHRDIRNRKYSYEEDYYDDDYYDDGPNSPGSNEYMYRRDSPSRTQSVFSFVDQSNSSSNSATEDDAEIIDAMLPLVKNILGSKYSDPLIIEELRKQNYDMDKTVISISEKAKTTNLPISLSKEIVVPSLDFVASNLEKKAESQSISAVVIGQSEDSIVNKVKVEDEKEDILEEEKPEVEQNQEQPKVAPENRSIAFASGVTFTSHEIKSFEKAELRTQSRCLEQIEKLAHRDEQHGSTDKLTKEQKTKISMVIIGHVDAGKSTITGHLLYKLGYVSQRLMHKYEKESREVGKASFAYAWVMDAGDEERERGVTMDIGTSYLETKTKFVTLLDAPGHRDFIPNMIAGAAQADVAILVVPAAVNEFESAFELSGQTKEHTLLVRSLGVTQLVVAVNKMDLVGWDKNRFDAIISSLQPFLISSGFKAVNVKYVPVSGTSGENLHKQMDVKACPWYTGPSLVDAIDAFNPPPRQISKPFRMGVSDVSRSMSLGNTISGRIFAGAIAVGDTMLLMPAGIPVTIKGIEIHGQSSQLASAGDTVDLGLTQVDPNILSIGSILCSIASPVPLVRKFEAKIMTMPTIDVPLVRGTGVSIHIHSVDEPANISRLIGIFSTTTGELEPKKPRCITKQRSAVVQITCNRRIGLELFSAYRQLGRFTLRDRGKTIAAGIVTQILD